VEKGCLWLWQAYMLGNQWHVLLNKVKDGIVEQDPMQWERGKWTRNSWSAFDISLPVCFVFGFY
jgi:hypothetical protein